MKKIMEETKEVYKKELLTIISDEDANEFKSLASGRKFCKKGERVIDICNDEVKRYKSKNANIFLKLINMHKNNRNKYLIENRLSSNVRAIAADCIRNNEDCINEEELASEVKKIILQTISEYKKI